MSYIPQLTVALCSDKKTYIGIENANIEKTYYCPCCGEEVYPKALNSKFVKMHFCHRNNSCNNENIKHFIKKWEFANRKVIEELDLQYDNAKIEEEHITEYGKYIPDVTLYLSDGTQVFLEIKNTNKKSSDYILKWDYLGCDVIEYDINKNSYYYLYKNNEFCQELKISRKEKSYIEMLKYIKENHITKERYEKLHSFWLACQDYTSDNNSLSIIEAITNMNLDDCIWCVTQLKKIQCNKEIINIITPEIEKYIFSEYKNECLLYLKYGIYKRSPFGFYFNFCGEYISDRMGAFGSGVLISQKNIAICNQYLDFLKNEERCSYKYLMNTRKNLQVFLQYLYCNKGNKFILDVDKNDIKDFKNYTNNLNLAPKDLHCLLGTIYSIKRYKNNKYNIAINLNDLIDAQFYGLSYILCKYYKRVNQIHKIPKSKIEELFFYNDFVKWLASNGEIPRNRTELKDIEKLIFNENVFFIMFFDELSYSTSVDIKKHSDIFGNNCFDYIPGGSYEKMLYYFIQSEYQNGNSIKNILLYTDSILHYKNIDENIIKKLLGFIEGIYMALEISRNNK